MRENIKIACTLNVLMVITFSFTIEWSSAITRDVWWSVRSNFYVKVKKKYKNNIIALINIIKSCDIN